MRAFYTLLAALPATLAAPVKGPGVGSPIKDQWLVKLRAGASSADLQSVIAGTKKKHGGEPTHVWDTGGFKGFSINGPDTVATAISNDNSVVIVEQDKLVKTNALATQQNAPYGLARISHREKGANTYVYDDSAGKGTYAYIIDTGIYVEHSEFEGRATFATNFADNDNHDANGHGTHVAGTIGGKTYGVAKKTNLIGLKVFDSSGAGSFSAVIAALDWAVQDAKNNSRINKSVANLSLGGGRSDVVNAAIKEAVNQGLFCAVAAGNDGKLVKDFSPASEPLACVAGAIDANDVRPDFSNYGQLVDVFAPGVFVESAWISGPDSTAVLSGTSMASPHVAGLGAYLLGLGYGGPGGSPLCKAIKKISTKGAVVNGLNSPNAIAFNGGGAGAIKVLGQTWDGAMACLGQGETHGLSIDCISDLEDERERGMGIGVYCEWSLTCLR